MAIASVNRKLNKKNGEIPFIDTIKKMKRELTFHGRISSKDIGFFTSQLSLMVEVGTPLNVCLATIVGQLKNQEFKRVMKAVMNDVEAGTLLSRALAKYPHIFSDVYISMVNAGESTGQLREMLDRLVEIQEKEERFLAMIKKALTYPSILCVVSFAVVVFLLIYVFPRFAVLFNEIEDILPVSTKLLLFLSSSMRSYWYITAITLGISGWALYTFIKSTKGQLTIHRLKINLPIVSNIFIRIYLVQMMRTLGFLIGCNIPLMQALKIARGSANNLVFAGFIDNVIENVEAGKGMSLAFTESPYVPENAKQIIKTGEETQNLAKVMLRLSDSYEGELDRRMTKLAVIIEPVLLIIMGGVVGSIVMSLILPIFKLSRVVH